MQAEFQLTLGSNRANCWRSVVAVSPNVGMTDEERGQTLHKRDILMHHMLSLIGCVPRSRRQETMRMTINVDEQLLMQAKAQAATLGVTLPQLIEDACE